MSAASARVGSRWLLALRGGALIGLLLIAAVAAAKLVVSILLRGPENWMDRALPVVSMAGICFIIAIITSRSREQLLTVGLALIAAAILHNTAGYVLGYWGEAAGTERDRLPHRGHRGGPAERRHGLRAGDQRAAESHAALAPAIFGPWMNVSGFRAGHVVAPPAGAR